MRFIVQGKHLNYFHININVPDSEQTTAIMGMYLIRGRISGNIMFLNTDLPQSTQLNFLAPHTSPSTCD